MENIKKIYITASGGPFLKFKQSQLKKITPEQALKHPKWKMGKKISIDSSTLMNKIFEVIEAQKVFNIPSNKIDILIHPNSLVHAILQLKNGFSILNYHETSMIIPLANALFDTDIDIKEFFKEKQMFNLGNLEFEKVNKKIFPVVKLKKIMSEYTSAPIIINASNEILVDLFLRKKVQYLDIIRIIMAVLNDGNFKKYAIKKPKTVKQIYQIDNWARKLTLKKANYE